MAEFSTWWTTGGAGDGSATINRADHSKWASVIGGGNGVTPKYSGYTLNELPGSAPAANTWRVGTGGAIVDGKPYLNDANVDINIPSASGGGNTRIDRIVLRANWTAQTVRLFRIAGTDAASPVPPALVQNPGSSWDLPLYQVRVDTAGVVTLQLDERLFRQLPATGLEDKVVLNTKLRYSAGNSVIGRSSGITGPPADIAAGANDRILACVTGALSWVQLTLGMIPDNIITRLKMATEAKPGQVLIQEQVLAAGAQTITFSGIPATYTHLKLIVQTQGASGGQLHIRFNNDSGNNYSYFWGLLRAASQAWNVVDPSDRILAGVVFSSGISTFEITIPNYRRTVFQKQAFSLSGGMVTTPEQTQVIGLWKNTAAVNRVDLANSAGVNYIAGSIFSLYGLY